MLYHTKGELSLTNEMLIKHVDKNSHENTHQKRFPLFMRKKMTVRNVTFTAYWAKILNMQLFNRVQVL